MASKLKGVYQINSQVALLAFVCGKSFVRDSIRDLEEIEEDIATSDTQLEIDEYCLFSTGRAHGLLGRDDRSGSGDSRESSG